MFFQDVVDRVDCPECEAVAGQECQSTDFWYDEIPISHEGRYAAYADAITPEELARLGLQMLERFREMQRWREEVLP